MQCLPIHLWNKVGYNKIRTKIRPAISQGGIRHESGETGY